MKCMTREDVWLQRLDAQEFKKGLVICAVGTVSVLRSVSNTLDSASNSASISLSQSCARGSTQNEETTGTVRYVDGSHGCRDSDSGLVFDFSYKVGLCSVGSRPAPVVSRQFRGWLRCIRSREMVHVGPAFTGWNSRPANCPPGVHPAQNQDTPIFHEIEIGFILLVILVDEKGFEPSASSLRTRKNLS
jgi:hypothetical protein